MWEPRKTLKTRNFFIRTSFSVCSVPLPSRFFFSCEDLGGDHGIHGPHGKGWRRFSADRLTHSRPIPYYLSRRCSRAETKFLIEQENTEATERVLPLSFCGRHNRKGGRPRNTPNTRKRQPNLIAAFSCIWCVSWASTPNFGEELGCGSPLRVFSVFRG